jgi:hypothetical protein
VSESNTTEALESPSLIESIFWRVSRQRNLLKIGFGQHIPACPTVHVRGFYDLSQKFGSELLVLGCRFDTVSNVNE